MILENVLDREVSPGDLSPCLVINSAILLNNFHHIQKTVGHATVVPVLKTDAYTLGARKVAKLLYKAGAKRFAVSTHHEARDIQSEIPEAIIDTFFGMRDVPANRQKNCHVWINTLDELELAEVGDVLHMDTGINRYGIAFDDLDKVIHHKSLSKIHYIASHLGCADTPDHPLNKKQLDRIEIIQKRLQKPVSLVSSFGIFLDSAFHCDHVRPGLALYGLMPKSCGLQEAVSVWGQLMYVRKIPAGESVGYGASVTISEEKTIATVCFMGYADGILRARTSILYVKIGPYKCPTIGQISMDFLTIDVSHVPENTLKNTRWVNIYPDGLYQHAIDHSTTPHDTLVKFSNRVKRVWV